MKYTVLYIFFFILFVFIHYIEGITLMGSLSMAQLWKIPLLAFLIFKCVSSIRRRVSFEKFGCLFSLETLLSPETIVNPTRAIVKFSKQLPLILFSLPLNFPHGSASGSGCAAVCGSAALRMRRTPCG